MATVEPLVPPDPTAALRDLRGRLRGACLPDSIMGAGWGMGVDVNYLSGLLDHWAERYDWPGRQAALWRVPHVRVAVADLRIHAMHVRSDVASAIPIVLTHGWPDAFWRYTKVIEPLTDPVSHGGDARDAFHVVVPDIPGFGFSETPSDRVLDFVDVADVWAEVMETLGYSRYGAAGGDIGSHVTRALALNHADRLIGVHRTDAGLPRVADTTVLSESEREWIKDAARWSASEGAYAAIHGTKPQTAAVGLTDSPAGLAAWIVEKLRSWSDCGGDIESVYSVEEVLDLLTIYWLTGTIGSSMRMYRANFAVTPDQFTRRVEVPSGFSIFPADVLPPPDEWLKRVANTIYIGRPDRGGHFAAFEQPDLYVEELRAFFRPLR